MITKKRLCKLLESAEYRFAKSMPKTPHWYTMSHTWKRSDFVQAVEGIRHYGKLESFYRVKFIYFYAGDYKYWTMGAEIQETILINRAKVKDDNAEKKG